MQSRESGGDEVASDRQAIQLLAELMAENLGIDAAPLKEALFAREKLGSTVIGNGVGLPHAQSDAVQAPVAAVIFLKEPLACAAPDDIPVDIFIGFLAPTGGSDLGLLAKVVRQLRDDTLLDELRKASAPKAAFAALKSRGLA